MSYEYVYAFRFSVVAAFGEKEAGPTHATGPRKAQSPGRFLRASSYTPHLQPPSEVQAPTEKKSGARCHWLAHAGDALACSAPPHHHRCGPICGRRMVSGSLKRAVREWHRTALLFMRQSLDRDAAATGPVAAAGGGWCSRPWLGGMPCIALAPVVVLSPTHGLARGPSRKRGGSWPSVSSSQPIC